MHRQTPWGRQLRLAVLMAMAAWMGTTAVAEDTTPQAESNSPSEVSRAGNSLHWMTSDLLRAAKQQDRFIDEPAVSFVYDGRASAELLPEWKKHERSHKLDARRTARERTWIDPDTGLKVRVVGVAYGDYPVVEWTGYLKNTGAKPTPILSDILGLDIVLERAAKADTEFILHGIQGDSCTAESFRPYQMTLGPKAAKRFAPPDYSGKSCDGPDGWPYFNLQVPGGGVILAVGWPGQWAASFKRDDANRLTIQAGQQRTRLRLKPGEEIRTPLIATLFWEGADVVEAQNLWRRWYIEHNMPRVDGRTQQPILQIQSDGANTAAVEAFFREGIRPTLCWRDAGGAGSTWFPGNGPYEGAMGFLNTGTWEVDPKKYPNGFKPFSRWLHARRIQFLLWFEPERVGDPNSWLAKNHPEWLLPGTSHGSLLDEGNPKARKWLINHIDGIIKTQGLDWYREDMNGGGPLPAWRKNDAEDRQGITENLYIQGHLAYWDELRRRNPRLRIDSCASGGRRNDLESMRRAVPLLRSDYQFPDMQGVVEGNQGHTYGLSSWLPFQGTGVYFYKPYEFRSFYLTSFGMGSLTPENTAAQKKAYAECRKIAPMMLGDYYPLGSYSLDLDRWIAWQFNRPELGDGVIQAFRRANCDSASMSYRLRGLDPASQYEVSNFDAKRTATHSGEALMEKGLSVEIAEEPGAAVIVYRRLDESR